jgi:hypothetical protein
MSLSHTIHRETKTVPPKAMETIESDSDKVVIENILIAAQELLPFINISSTNIAKYEGMYRVTVALCAGDICVSLHDMAVLQRNWPARIADIKLRLRAEGAVLCFDVVHEGHPIAVTQLDVVRVSKRQRFC